VVPEPVLAAELSPEVVVLAAEPVLAAELSPEVVVLAELLVEPVLAAELSPEVVVLAAELVLVAELSPEVVVLAAEPVLAAELSPEVVVLVAEPVLAELLVEPVFDVAEPQASVDIAVVFVALVPVSAVVVEVDSSGHPKFFVFPNICSFPNCSSSAEVAG
jgi:hypothetical protein